MCRRAHELFADFRETGDPTSLGVVYDLLATDLLRVAMTLVPSPSQAEDVLQSTFLAAIERAQHFDPSRPLVPWLVGILTNQARLLRAREQRTPDPDRLHQMNARGPLSEAEGSELEERLREVVSRLPVAHASVLKLRLRHGLDPAEIADVLDRPPGTVRAQLARGMRALRRLLPAGLVGALGVVLGRPTRGLAAVRRAVVTRAAGTAPATALGSLTLLSGISIMNKLVVAMVLGLLLLAWGMGVAERDPAPCAPSMDTGSALMGPNLRQSAAALATPTPEGAAEVPRRALHPQRRPAIAPAGLPTPTTGRLVVRADQGAPSLPLDGSLILVDAFGPDWAFATRHEAHTNHRGIAVFEELPAGLVTIQRLRGGQSEATIVAGKTREVRLQRVGDVTVYGEVIDAFGQAIPGAQLWLGERWRWNVAYPVALADRAGRFRLPGVTLDHYLGASAAGRARSFMYPIRGQAGGNTRLVLVLDEPASSLTGRVSDVDGTPLVDALVVIGAEVSTSEMRLADGSGLGGRAPMRLRTDAMGQFQANHLPAGLLPLQARAAGFAPTRVDVQVSDEDASQVELVLTAHASVAGTVRDAHGEPLARCRIHTVPEGLFASSSTFSGADGTFLLEGLASGRVALRASHPPAARAAADLDLVTGGVSRWDPMLEVRPHFRGRVVAESGDALAGWRVVALPQPTGRERFRSDSADADGRFSVEVREDVPHTLWVYPPGGWRSFPALIVPDLRPSGEATELTVSDASLRTGAIVAQTVDADGRPVPGARMTIWHAQQRLWREQSFDDRGALRIDNVPPGTLGLEVRSEHHPWLRLGTFELAQEATLDLGTLTLERPGTFTAQLVGVPDSALETLSFVLSGTDQRESGVVRRTGRELHSSPLGPGTHTLSANGDFVANLRQDLRIVAGEVTHVELVFERAGLRTVVFERPPAARATRYLSCSVFDDQGRRVWMVAVVRPDEQGIFRTNVCVAPGTYRLIGETNNGLRSEAALTVTGWDGADSPLALRLAWPDED